MKKKKHLANQEFGSVHCNSDFHITDTLIWAAMFVSMRSLEIFSNSEQAAPRKSASRYCFLAKGTTW